MDPMPNGTSCQGYLLLFSETTTEISGPVEPTVDSRRCNPRTGVSTFRSDSEMTVDNSPRPLAGERGDRVAVGEGIFPRQVRNPEVT